MPLFSFLLLVLIGLTLNNNDVNAFVSVNINRDLNRKYLFNPNLAKCKHICNNMNLINQNFNELLYKYCNCKRFEEIENQQNQIQLGILHLIFL